MDWNAVIEKASRAVDVIIKAEIHALLLIGVGALLGLHGQKEIGMPLITAGCTAFKGNR